MKISVQTAGAIDVLGIDAGFAAIKQAGFDAVDLGLDSAYVWDDLCNGKKNDFYNDDKIYPYVNEIKAAAEKYGIEFGQTHAPFPSYIPRSEQGTLNCQDDIRKCIEITGYVGCPRIVVHPLFDGSARFPSLTKEQEYNKNIEFYSSLIPLLKKHHVVCCLENMWMQDWKSKKIYAACCSDINETIKYIDDLNAMAGERLFGFCLDIGHLLLVGQDPCYWIEKLGDRLETLHVHDNDGVGDDHIAPYLGCCNWDRVVLGLRNIGYKNNFNFEASSFNRKFPKELCGDALKMLGSIGKYFVGRITAEEDQK